MVGCMWGSHRWLLRYEHKVGPKPHMRPLVAAQSQSHLLYPLHALPHPAPLLAVRHARGCPFSVSDQAPLLIHHLVWRGGPTRRRWGSGLAWTKLWGPASIGGRESAYCTLFCGFQGPKGQKGDPGEAGPIGPKGEAGEMGLSGLPVCGWVGLTLLAPRRGPKVNACPPRWLPGAGALRS